MVFIIFFKLKMLKRMMGATPFVSPSAEEIETEDIIKGKNL